MRNRVLAGLAIAATLGALTATPALAAPAHHAAPACDPGRLSVSVDGIDAGAGQRYTTLGIATTGRACVIAGTPARLTFLDAADAALVTTPVAEGPSATPVTIDATHPAQLVLHTSPIEGDGATISPTKLSFYLPGARTATVIDWAAGDVDQNGTVGYGAIQATPAG